MLLLAAAVLAATPIDLADRLRTAAAGDTIRMAAGDYGLVTITGRQFNPPIRIEAGTARLQLHIIDSSGINVSGGLMSGPGAKGAPSYAALVRQSSRINFSGVNFVASGVGMVIDQSTDVTVKGGQASGSRVDGIDIATSQRVLVDGFACLDFQPGPGVHPDCVQLWSRKELPVTADVTVQNVVARGNMQGITAFNHPEKGDPGFDRIRLLNNRIEGGFPQGVALYDARDSVVTGNRTSTFAGARFRTMTNVVRCIRCTVANNRAAPKP